MTATKILYRLLVLPLAALTIGACGQAPDEARTNGTVTDEPWGRAFLSTGVTEDGNPRPLVEGTQIRLNFNEDGTGFGATAGCNSMGGTARIEDGQLVVGDLATTEMGCDEARHAQDEWLADFLTGRPAMTLTGPDMVLSGGGTEVRLSDREVADPDRPLRGTKWVVDGVVSGDAASSVPQGAEAFIVFSETEEDAFGGNTGCNGMGGKAVVADTTIEFSEVITTKMFCDDDRGDLERAVIEVLDGEVTFKVEADRLTLNHPDGKGLMLKAQEA
jgi:heat shock protein HslJ